MNVQLFDIVNDEVVLSPNVLLIPQFAALKEKYSGHLKILAGIHFLTYPHPENNPYYNIKEDDKEEVIKKDFFSSTDLTDLEEPVFISARQKMNLLYDTTIIRFHRSHKQLMDRVADLQGTDIKTWPDKMNHVQNQLKQAGQFVEEFVKSQNAVVTELGRTRGELDEGYDEGRSYSGGL